MPLTKQAAGIVLLTRSRPVHLLLLKHKNRWDLPKGHADPGEDLVTTALRETEEETGIAPAAITLDNAFEYRFSYDVEHKKHGRYHKQVIYFLGYVAEPCDVQLTEHLDYRWLTWPPGRIQTQTIDPLMDALRDYLGDEVHPATR